MPEDQQLSQHSMDDGGHEREHAGSDEEALHINDSTVCCAA